MMHRSSSSSARRRSPIRRPCFFRPGLEQLEDRTMPSATLNLAVNGPATALPGTNIDYTVTLDNTGPDAAQGVSLTDMLPSGTTFVSQTQTSGPVFTLSQSGGTLTDTLATMAAGTSAAFDIVVTIPANTPNYTTLVDQAFVSTTSLLSSSSGTSASVSTTVDQPSAALNLAVSGQPMAFPGSNVDYSVTLNNYGPEAAQGVSLSETLPSGTTFVSQTQTSGPAFTLSQSGGSVTDTLATMAAGTSAVFDIVVTIPAKTPINTTLVDQSSVSATSPLSSWSVTSASASTTVVSPDPPPSTSLGWTIDADPQPTGNGASNNGLAIDGNNNSIITGPFVGTTYFGSTTLTSAGGQDGYIAKYDPNGKLLWAERLGGSGNDQATRVATDASGNIYVDGSFTGQATFGNFTLNSVGGSTDGFIAKLDPSGNFIWVSQIDGTSTDWAAGLAVDSSGNVYATGWFNETASVMGPTTSATLTSNGGQDAFVVKLNSAGDPDWARNMGSSGSYDWGIGVTVDPNGNVYATGKFSGTASFGSYSLTSNSTYTNAYVAMLDSSGNFKWAQRMGGDADTTNQGGFGIAVDARSTDSSNWAVYVTGMMDGNADFGSTTLTSYGTDDAFVTKLNAATGSFDWADQLGGAGQDEGWAIALDGSGNVYTVGTFGVYSQSANFDPHGSFIMYPGTGNGGQPVSYVDAYVSELDSNGNFVAAWQTNASANGGTGGKGLAVDKAGDIWTSGGFNVTTTFPNGQTMSITDGVPWAYVSRLNAPHGAAVGTVYADLNQNGKRDGEPPLAGWTVDAFNSNDQLVSSAVTDIHGRYEINGLAPGTYTILPVLPSGWTTTAPASGAYTVTVGNGFVRNDFGEYTPTTQTTYTQSKSTEIKGRTTVQSTLNVSDSYSLLDVDVQVNISYSSDGLLSLYLIAPDGTTVPLWIENGASGSNFTNTIFDDEASTSINSGTAPFSGSYQTVLPALPLAGLQNTNVYGTWTLQVSNPSITTGKINSWSLIATHATNSNLSGGGGTSGGGKGGGGKGGHHLSKMIAQQPTATADSAQSHTVPSVQAPSDTSASPQPLVENASQSLFLGDTLAASIIPTNLGTAAPSPSPISLLWSARLDEFARALSFVEDQLALAQERIDQVFAELAPVNMPLS